MKLESSLFPPLLRSFAIAAVAGFFLTSAVPARAATYYWGALGTAAWTGTNWTTDPTGSAPLTNLSGTTDTAYFNGSSVSSPSVFSLGASTSVAGMIFNNGSTVTGTNTGGGNWVMTIGSGGLLISSGAIAIGGNFLNSGISFTLGADQTWTNNSAIGWQTMNRNAINTNGFTLTFDGSGNIIQTLNVNGAISGAGSLVKNGAGTLTLSSPNTFTGSTLVNSGLLVISQSNALLSSALDLSGTGKISTNGIISILETGGLKGSGSLNQANITGYSAITNLILKPVTGSVVNFFGDIGEGANGMGLQKTGSGIQILSGSNSYTGLTSASMGVLQFGKTVAFYGGNTANWVPSKVTVANGATVAFSVGGPGEFSTGDLTTLLNNFSIVTGSSGLMAGSAIGFDTTNSGSSFMVSNTISNSTGSGGGIIGLAKLGANTLVVSSSNSYTGPTTLYQGTLKYLNLNAFASGTLSFLGTATLQAGVSGTLTQSLNVNAGVLGTFDTGALSATISGGFVSGSGTLVKIGSGSLFINTPSSIGGIVITVGTVGNTVGRNQPFGGPGVKIFIGDAVVGADATLSSANTNTFIPNKDIVIASGAGRRTIQSTAPETFTTFGATISGTNDLILQAITDPAAVLNLSGTLTLAGSISTGATQAGGHVNISGPIGPTVTGVNQNSAGTLVLSGTDTYAGATSITNGTLVVKGSLTATASVSGSYGTILSVDGGINTGAIITSEGTVQGKGTVGALVINASGNLAPGMSIAAADTSGTLTVDGVIFSSSSAQLSIRLGQSAPSAADVLALSPLGTGVNLNGITLTLSSGTNYSAGISTPYVIIDGSAATPPNGPGTLFINKFAQGDSVAFGGTNYSILYNVDATGLAVGNNVVLIAAPAPAAAPAVTTGGASGITHSSSTLNGSINPNGLATTCFFQYGLTADYGSATATQSAGNGINDAGFNSPITGLADSTTYHYRLVATNGIGTSYGIDQEFVTPANNAPVATTKSVTTNEDTASAFILSGTDADGDPLSYIVLTNPAAGVLSGTAPSLTYTPNANYNGSDSFTFKVNDGALDSSAVTVAITVTAVNDAPAANAQSVTTNEDTAKAIVLTGTDVEGSPLTYAVVANPAHGVLSGTGANLTYTPSANYNGSDSFTFKVNDGALDSSAATVAITVTAVNDAPVANARGVITNEDTPTAILLTGSDVEGSPLTYAVVASPTNGALSGTGANLTYTPNPNYNGSDSFTFKVNDGALDSSEATVSITVTAVNDAPVANAQSVITDEDTAMPILLTGTDVEGSALTFTVLTNPAHGVLSGTLDGQTYTPTANYNGSDSFTFRVSDGLLLSNTATVSITVNAVNDPPIANSQSVTTNEDIAKFIVLSGTDVERSPLTYTVVISPTNGVLSGSGTSRVYTPSANFNGSDSFTFKVNDGALDSNEATVSITVIAVNDAPVANAQSVTTDEDTPAAILLTGTDVEGSSLTFTVLANPLHGTLSGTGANRTYAPTANYNGTDSFSFRVSDGLLLSNTATVSITIFPVNDAPVASNQSVSTNEDVGKSIILVGTDVEGSPLSYTVLTGPAHGGLFGSGTSRVYSPFGNFNGTDSFTFKVNDGTLDSNEATVSITVIAVNDAPVAYPQSLTTDEDTPTAVLLTGSDVEGSALTFTVLTNPAHGALSGTGASWTYAPAANYNGSDTFTFRVSDGSLFSNTATVSLNINSVPDAPVAISDAAATEEDVAVSINVLANDTDGDGDRLQVQSFTQPAHGGVNTDGTFLKYTPAANFNGTDSFTYVSTDGVLTSNTATVTITVNAVNDAPLANSQEITTAEDTAKGILLSGTDVDGTSMAFFVLKGPANGSLSGTAPNLTYTPNSNYNGSDSFTFKVNDGALDSNEATVSIDVTAVNDPPIANTQSLTTAEDTATPIVLTATDVEGSPLSYSVLTSPAHGVLTGTGANLTYTPNANYNGSDGFTFKVNDGDLDSNAATVSITVTAVNDAPVANALNLSTDEDTAKAVVLTGTDIEGDPLVFTILRGPTSGTLSGTAPNLAYTPNSNYNGSDSFTYRVNDGALDSNEATVSITVTAVNDSPVANAQSVTTTEDTATPIVLTGSDVEQSPLIFTVLTNPTNGVISGTGPNLTYTPNANFNGSDHFTFKANDGALDSTEATVSITVAAVNDAPVANAQNVTTNEDTMKAIVLTGTDVEGSPMTYEVLTNPAQGALSGTAPNLIYTPVANYNGSDSFTFKVNDGALDSNEARVNITVTAVNDAPVAVADRADAHGAPVAILVTANDSDVDNDVLTVSAVTQGLHGAVSISGSQTLTYTPGLSFGASDGDTFTYTLSDGNGGSATGLVSVSKRNTPPVAVGDAAVSSGSSVTVAVLANDMDAEGDPLSVTGVSQGATGSVTFTGTTAIYTPARLMPLDQFTYTISDGYGGSSTATVTIRAGVPVEVDSKDAAADASGAAVNGEPSGTTLAKLGVPSIRAAGFESFSGVLRSGSVFFNAVVTGTDLRVLARQAQLAPDEAGNPMAGAAFAKFSDPIINDAGSTAFVATLSGSNVASGNKTGLWTNAFGPLSLVARIGLPAPGMPLAKLAAIDSVVLTDGSDQAEASGIVAFTGRLATGSGNVTGDNNSALWGMNAGGASILLREGDFLLVDNMPMQLKAFIALGVVKGSPGQGRSSRENSVVVQAYFSNKIEAILLVAPGHVPEVVAREGLPIAGASAGMFVSSFGAPTLNGVGDIGGRVRFVSGLGGVTSANAEAILLGGTAGDYAQMLVRQQDPAPDANGVALAGGGRFKQLTDPVINSQGFTAFTAVLTGTGVKGSNDTGLWWGKPGNLRLVAREGDPAPGTAGKFASFVSLVLPDDSSPDGSVGPVFVAKLSGVKNNLGLWALNSHGTLQLVVQKGGLAKVNGIEMPITDITVLGAVPGTLAQARSYNSERKLIYRLTFKGNLQKIVTTAIP